MIDIDKIDLLVKEGERLHVEFKERFTPRIDEDMVAFSNTNALIHRDYSIRGTSLTVEVYDDRIEITNPGGIPESLDKKSFGRVSIRRNELIADLFHRMDKGERAGTGIRRMNEAMKAAELPMPEVSSGTFYTITFRRPDFNAVASQGVESGLSRDQVGTMSGLSWDQVQLLSNAATEKAITELMVVVGRTNRTKFRDQLLTPLLNASYIEMTIPEKPRSSRQKYRLTEKGRAVIADRQGDKAS